MRIEYDGREASVDPCHDNNPSLHEQYREPLKANTISGVAIVAVGDVISQFLETDEKTGRKRCSSLGELEPRRIANAGACVWVGGVCVPVAGGNPESRV